MEWDGRIWLIFMWGISTIMFLCAFSSPYLLPGNRISTVVSYGGNVIPEGVDGYERYGLWGDIPVEKAGYMHIVQAAMCGALVFGVLVGTGIIVALVKCGDRRLIQYLTALVLGLGSLCNIIGVLAFKFNAPEGDVSQAYYMSMATAVIWGLCAVCALVQPLLTEIQMNVGQKIEDPHDPEAGVPLTKK